MMHFRDYLYLDYERVLSLVAQADEGASVAISTAEGAQRTTEERGSRVSEEVNSTRSRLTTSVVHDHAFTLMERLLGRAVRAPTGIDDATHSGESGAICKFTGKVRFYDYDYIAERILELRELAIKAAYLGSHAEVERVAAEARAKLEGLPAKERAKKARAIEREMEASLAQAVGAANAPQERIAKAIAEMTTQFKGGAYEIVLAPQVGDYRVRAIVNKNWLRHDPAAVRALYGDSSDHEWEIWGLVTDIRRPDERDRGGVRPSQGSIAAAYDALFDRVRAMERLFVSPIHAEVVVYPIAVFRSFSGDSDGEE